MDDILAQEEMMWYKKSRVSWLKDGDKNTTFFQLSTIIRRWKNKITAIKDEQGNWVQSKNEVQKVCVDYFK